MAYPLATSDSLAYVGIGLQSSKGTGVSPTLFVPYRGPVTLDGGQAAESIYAAGTGPYANRQMKTAHDPKGSFGMGMRPNTISELIAYFLGADSIAGAGPYDHTITPDERARRWLTIEQAFGTDGDIIERFVDAVLTSLTISVDGNQDWIATLGWTSLDAAWQATAATPSYETGVAGSTPGSALRGADATYTIDGSAETNVKMCEIALEWKYDEDIRLADVTRRDALKLELAGTVKLTQLIDDTDTRDRYRAMQYGSASGTSPANDPYRGSLTAVINNGLTSTNEREVQMAIPAIDWMTPKYTDLDPSGATGYLESEGTITKASGSEFVTATCKTSDSAVYVS